MEEKSLNNKIEFVRELLYKKFKDNTDKEVLQQISESLDKLIIDYYNYNSFKKD